MIFKSPGDTQGHSVNSEISAFFGMRFPMLFCLFRAIFIIIVWEAKYFEAKGVQTV